MPSRLTLNFICLELQREQKSPGIYPPEHEEVRQPYPHPAHPQTQDETRHEEDRLGNFDSDLVLCVCPRGESYVSITSGCVINNPGAHQAKMY